MNQIGRRFALSDTRGSGVCCDERGLFVGGIALFEQAHGPTEPDRWQPRPVSTLNRELGMCYGLPVEFDSKLAGLATVARALNRGDLLHAQIATLHLQIPDPPPLTKAPRSVQEFVELARQLHASGLLKAEWDPTKHPRWPAGSPDSTGGQFAPVGTTIEDSSAGERNAPVVPADIVIPMPFEVPGFPLPSEILPPPVIPDISPRSNLRNPYPDRPECEEEWAHALKYCRELLRTGRMGKDGYRGFGRSFQQCVLGLVREDCGGSLKS